MVVANLLVGGRRSCSVHARWQIRTKKERIGGGGILMNDDLITFPVLFVSLFEWND